MAEAGRTTSTKPGRSPGLGGRVLSPARRFLHDEAAGGVVLLLAAVAGLVWANSGAAEGYVNFWDHELTFGAGVVTVSEDLQHWVNDGLMVLFFFVVGLEIKRELVVGELSTPRVALLPVLAAAGGVLVPALIFLAVTGGGPGSNGWGIPMATDIAFAVGILALLGKRIPAAAKVFLLSVAIVDDIIAVAVIAIAYTDSLSLGWLLAAFGGLGAVVVLRRTGVTAVLPYVPVGLFVWFATLNSGVHATIAGVALGLLTPAVPVGGREVLNNLQHRLHPFSAFVVVPLFALANTGVYLRDGALSDAATSGLAWAVFLGLVVGKIVGIGGVTVLVRRLRIGELPAGMPVNLVWGLAALAGIGFTVSLFITDLAYDDGGLVTQAKVGIFAASVVAAVVGSLVLRALTRRPRPLDSPAPDDPTPHGPAPQDPPPHDPERTDRT